MARLIWQRKWVDDLRRLADPDSRYVDLAIAFRPKWRRDDGVVEEGERGPVIGYRWDKWGACTAGPPLSCVELTARREALDIILPKPGVDTDGLFGGRQATKSFGAADRVVVEAIGHPNQLGLVCSPTYQQSKQIWQRVLWRLPHEWLAEKPRSSPPAYLTLWNGAVIEFVSLNHPDSARSRTIAWAVVDEFGLCEPEAISNVVLSGIVEGEDFRLFVTATPNRLPWLRRWFDEHRADPQARLRHLSTEGNPFAKKGNYARLAKGLGPRLRRQELEGQFPEDSSRCYPSYDERRHVVDHFPSEPDQTADFLRVLGCDNLEMLRRCEWFGGHDWGKKCQATVLGKAWRRDGRWELYFREVVSFNKTVEAHADRLVALTGKASAYIICDASDPEKKHGRQVFEGAGFYTEGCGPKNPRQTHRIEALNNLLDEVPGADRPVLRFVRYATVGGREEEISEYLRDGLLGLQWAVNSDRATQEKGSPTKDQTHGPDALGYWAWKHYAPRVFLLDREKHA